MFGFTSSSPPYPTSRGPLPFDGFSRSTRPSPPSNNALSRLPTSNTPSVERHTTCTNQFFLSPDGRSHHSYSEGTIISCFAPFNQDSLKVITSLPTSVQRAVTMDPLLGFICAGEPAKEKEMNSLPLMCLYTSSSAFLISIGYPHGNTNNSEKNEERGVILRLIEPFEKPLLSPLSPQIVRVRSAPEICRPGAMGCLLKENDGYSLILFHGIRDSSSTGSDSSAVAITTPLRFSLADLFRGRNDGELTYSSEVQIVDFCFIGTLALLLSNDGGVYAASPLVFDGMCLPRSQVTQMVSRLNDEIDEASSKMLSAEEEARVRQCKAAKRYFIDAFELYSPGDSYYVSAAVLHGKKAVSQAMSWQARLQGPLVMIGDQEHNNMSFQCIESFGSCDVAEGFVVARHDGGLTLDLAFGFVPGRGSVLLPRFEFESGDDSMVIDDLVRGTGAIVERVLVENDKEGEENGNALANTSQSLVPFSKGRSCSLVTDPLDDLMVHVVTSSRIVTVTTTALDVTSKCIQSRLDGKNIRDSNSDMTNIRTKLWSSFDSTSGSLIGAGVSEDVHLGHILVAKMSDGSTENVNITTTQCIHEASLQMEARMDQLVTSAAQDETPDILKNAKPLYELLQPLTDQVCNGLSKMGKIVGGNTMPKDVGPENLAVFIETQRSCNQNILLPMEEISRIVSGRKNLMIEMHESQSAELQRLSKLLNDLKTKFESNRQKVAELEAASSTLASRSSAIVTATRDLRPQITDAEAQYFKDLERYEMSCNKWDEQVKQISNDADATCKAMSGSAIESGEVHCLVDLSSDKIDLCHKMLRGEKELLKKTEYKINHSSADLQQVSPADIARQRQLEAEKENHENNGH